MISNIVISVKKNLTKPHPITIQTREGLKKDRIDKYGMKKPIGGGFDLRVSKVNERRALLIIDTLCKWFQKNGIKIYQPFKNSIETKVVIDNQELRIRIEEKSKLTATVLKERWGGYDYYEREYTPTGELSLVIDNYCWGCSLKKVWRDGQTSKVEERLGEFISTLFEHAKVENERKQRLEAEAVEKEKQRQLQRYHEACRQYEQQMIDKLIQQSRDFIQSKEIQTYIDEVKRLAKEQYKDDHYTVELIAWIIWAESYAKELNPLN